jgi:hypothetical protein
MTEQLVNIVDRRRFLTQVMPACSLACLWAGALGADDKSSPDAGKDDDRHKFDIETEMKMSPSQRVAFQNGNFIDFIKTLQTELDEEELIRLLEMYSEGVGRRVGESQAKRSPDTSFQTYVSTFRPPRYANLLTHEIVEDSAKAFEIRVTECVWAKVFRDAGLGGRVGQAAICNMDYYWPTAFNKNFKMERDKTLMQGDDYCNHRYMDMT